MHLSARYLFVIISLVATAGQVPTDTPTSSPLAPSVDPTFSSTTSVSPSVTPSVVPTVSPSVTPSVVPTASPFKTTTVVPSVLPSVTPSLSTSPIPATTAPNYSLRPTIMPSIGPNYSISPTFYPSFIPSLVTSTAPNYSPIPTVHPSSDSPTSTSHPTASPTIEPTATPTYSSCPAGQGYCTNHGYCFDCSDLFGGYGNCFESDSYLYNFYQNEYEHRYEYYNDGSSLQCDIYCGDYPLYSSFDYHSFHSCERTCPYPYYATESEISYFGTYEYQNKYFKDVCSYVKFVAEKPNIQAATIIATFIHGVMFLFCIVKLIFLRFGKNPRVWRENSSSIVKLIFVTSIPVIDVLTDLLYLLTATVKETLMIPLIVFYLHPVPLMLYDIYQRKALPKLRLITIPSYVWNFFDKVDNIGKLLVMIILCTPFVIINCIWMVPWLLFLFFLCSTKLNSISFLADFWYAVWKGETQQVNPWYVDLKKYKRVVIYQALLESIPHLAIQTINTVIYLKDATALYIVSATFSGLMISNVLYQYFYYIVFHRYKIREIPSIIDEWGIVGETEESKNISSSSALDTIVSGIHADTSNESKEEENRLPLEVLHKMKERLDNYELRHNRDIEALKQRVSLLEERKN